MRLIKRHIDNFDENDKLYGFVEYNENYKGKIIEDVCELSFTNLYANVIIGLSDEGINFSDICDVEFLRKTLSERDTCIDKENWKENW